MKMIALADLHLGFRAFPKVDGNGRNLREVDTEAAWEYAVNVIVDNPPHLVTIAGDIFHHPRVAGFAKASFLRGIKKILDNTQAHIVIAQGNHDAGKTADVMTPIALAEVFEDDRVSVCTTPEAVYLDIPGEGLACVSVFPYVTRDAAPESYKVEPDPDAKINVLLLHAAVKGSGEGDRLPYFYSGSDQALDIAREANNWDVIACGDFHEFTRLHPSRLAFYSGSLERTSSNIWGETAEKVLVMIDTKTETLERWAIPTRHMWDAVIDASDEVSPAVAVNEWMTSALSPAGKHYPDSLVRLKVTGFPRTDRDQIDWYSVRRLKAKCAHFYLDLRYSYGDMIDLGDRRGHGEKRLTLAEEAAKFFAEDDPTVRDLAISYLDVQADVEEVEEDGNADI